MKTLQDLNPKDKTIIVRVDYNVPMSDGKITDDLRIRASLPTIDYLRDHGAKKIILISHLGRPEGKDESLSLAPVAKALSSFEKNVEFVSDVSGSEVEKACAGLPEGGILLIENLRFYPGEEANSADFAKSIVETTGADVFVQDGFAVLHRAHASTDAIAKLLPSYLGLLVEKEVTNLKKALDNPTHPALLIIGGAKVDDKAPLIAKLSPQFDHIAIGGKIAADGYEAKDSKIYVATDFDEDSAGRKLDIGPLSTAEIADMIKDAKTIIWNGLLGYAEDPAYATSSTIVATLLGEKNDATTIICGGDTTGFVENLIKTHPDLKYSLISTGGGAALEFLLGKELPGLRALE